MNNNGTITWTKEVEKDKSLTVTFKVRVKKDVNGEVLKNKAKGSSQVCNALEGREIGRASCRERV